MSLSTFSGFTASGNITVCRFVSISGDFTVAQSGADEAAIGISQAGAGAAPIPGASAYAAVSGDPIRVFGAGEVCELEVAEAITAGMKVKPDSNGKAVECGHEDDQG